MQRLLTGAFAAVALLTVSATAGEMRPPQPSQNPTASPAGKYNLDEGHQSVLARVRHLGFGYTIVRLDRVTGTLDWDPADVTKSKLSIEIDPKLVSTPVMRSPQGGTFGTLLAGPEWLDAYGNPKVTFVSTKITKKDATHGTIEGTLTLKGVSKPVTIDAEFLMAGLNNQGTPTLAFTGSTTINRMDYGVGTFPKEFVGEEVQILLDVEFNRAPAS